MTEKFIPLCKRSKKAQKAFYVMQRRDWNGIDPATRTMQDGVSYNRKKLKHKLRKELMTETQHVTGMPEKVISFFISAACAVMNGKRVYKKNI